MPWRATARRPRLTEGPTKDVPVPEGSCAALLGCKDVTRDWREVYAVALYTYLRPGELRVLTWADVDLDAEHVSITKAWDYADEKIKPPKTSAGVRNVPVDAALLPLLTRMRADASTLYEGDAERVASALVVPRLSAFGEDHLAQQFRRHLRVAKIHARRVAPHDGHARSRKLPVVPR